VSNEAFELVRGGEIFVWPIPIKLVAGAFALEASTEPPPGEVREFARFSGPEFDVLLDDEDVGIPDEIHIAVAGRSRLLRAYWNGNSYGNVV
jgi:hypothetical protein